MGHHGSGKSHCNYKVRYVQGGLCEPGNGSKCHPWNSLALAGADHSWNKLVVLPSPVPLDGGILLRAGTKLVGSKSPVHGALESDQPTITNTSDATNGGNGVYVEGGDVKIKNIHFTNTFAAGINYDNAHNIKVKNVLITGVNQGKIVSEFPDGIPFWPTRTTPWPEFFIGGINATTTNSGKTTLCNVVVKDIKTGNGITENVKGGAKRKFSASNYEFVGGLLVEVDFEGTIAPVSMGMLLLQDGVGTNQKVKVSNSNFHDYSVKSTAKNHYGAHIYATNGSNVESMIEKSRFYHLSNLGISSFDIIVLAVSLTEKETGVISKVFDCYFEIIYPEDSAAIQSVGYRANTNNHIKGNTIINNYDAIDYFLTETTDYTLLENNYVEGIDLCYGLAGWTRWTNKLNSITQTVTLRNNNMVGGTDSAALTVLPGFTSGNNWKKLTMNVENNCLIADSASAWGILSQDYGGDGIGDGTINAHKNNFIGFDIDIADNANVNYNAQQNFWDGEPVVLNIDPVSVSDPLLTPIVCPKKKYCLSEPVVVGSVASKLTKEEKMERFKNKNL